MIKLEIILLEEARQFLIGLPDKAGKKMMFVLNQVKEGVKDSRLFKKLDGTEIWEFRMEYEGNAYRLLSFWDKEENSLVIATHGFSKKDQKTPKKEIKKAEEIRKAYFENNK